MSDAASAKVPRPRFWDNLIPLKNCVFGTQTAGWTPGPPAMSGLGCMLLADQMIPVAADIALASDVYLPKKPGRWPAVIAFAAYSKELHTTGAPAGNNETGNPPVFTDRGYAHVIVERRGMGLSGGATAMFFSDQDVDDHEKVIAWVAAQPWCNGEVVLFGTSYYGCVQAMVALRRPPALKAFFSSEMCTDYFRHIVAFGGTFNLYFFDVWMGANFSHTVMNLRLPPLVRALMNRILNSPLKHLWWPALQKRMPRIMRRFMSVTPVPEVRAIWANWMIDGKSRELCTVPPGPYAALGQIDVPFVVLQNLANFNLHQFGSYELFQKAGTPADRKWLILTEASYKLPFYEWHTEALAFFDHVLRGADNGYAAQPPVRYWLDGAGRYAGAPDFPVPGARPVRLYPASAGADAATHVLSAAAPAGGSNGWAAIPLGAPLPGGIAEVLNETLTYDLAVDRETEFSGPVTASLFFSSNEIDSFVIARLSRLDAGGGDHLLSLGAISPARRAIDAARGSRIEIAMDIARRAPLTPGEPVTLRFSLVPGPTRLKPGEKLRLRIASRTDLTLSDTAHDHAHFDWQVPPYFSRNTIHYGAETYIEVHEVGAADARIVA